MADAAAMAATLITLLALLQARHADRLAWSAAAGLALALTYTIRHPQLALVAAAFPALLCRRWSRGRRLAHLGTFAISALAGALPDLYYHQLAFGSPWTSESAEWFLLSPMNIPAAVASLSPDLWRRNEFGYLWPPVLLGLAASLHSREERADTVILLVGAGAVVLFHLCYQALRLRDLLPILPPLALWATHGAQVALDWARRGDHPLARCSALILAFSMALATRTAGTVTLPLAEQVETFGHLTASQRAAYVGLGQALPESAVVATSASAGAVLRYAERPTVRPAYWSAAELDRFVGALWQHGHMLYVLADGEEMDLWLGTLYGRYRLAPLGAWSVPRSGRGGQRLEGQASLYVLDAR